ncbi:hypothetical protein, partial [Lysinibacillus capsici]|uniref:hypothetical protein n=1 Tax=Lysinibacillus capsici TaxID=2115968 RepID=UPI00325FDD25
PQTRRPADPQTRRPADPQTRRYKSRIQRNKLMNSLFGIVNIKSRQLQHNPQLNPHIEISPHIRKIEVTCIEIHL